MAADMNLGKPPTIDKKKELKRNSSLEDVKVEPKKAPQDMKSKINYLRASLLAGPEIPSFDHVIIPGLDDVPKPP
jgi:hypothetical protein